MSAASTSPDDRIPEILLRRGAISVAQFADASAAVKPPKRVETVLVESGTLTAENLMRAATQQVQEIVCRAFQWTEGRYRLAAADNGKIAVTALKLRAADMILEAVRRLDSWERVCKGLGGLAARYQRSDGCESRLSEITGSREQLSILTDLVDEQSVRAICERSSLPDFEVCRLLWAFRIVGLVDRLDTAAAKARPKPAGSVALPPGPVPEQRPPRVAARSSSSGKTILAVGISQDLFDRLQPVLARASVSADRVPRAKTALALCRERPFDLILVDAAIGDMPIREFIAGLRERGSECANAQILVLADEAAPPPPVDAGGAVAVLPITAPARVLEEVASRLLGVAPRQAQRLLMKVELQLDQARQLLMCQTENISKVGMLLRSDRPFPLGATLVFDFTPPGDRSSIRGRAEVVRHTTPDVENVHGVGVRLLDFQADGRARWEAFLAKQDS